MPKASGHTSLPIPKGSKTVRLLDLNSSTRIDDPLVGNLRLASLDQKAYPQFNALSYVWGGGVSQQDNIACGISEIPITRNCRDALRQIRELCGTNTLWVDAICIDQTNDKEKAHQVPLMEEIYTKANMVYIWLGHETAALRRTIDCLTQAAKISYLPLDRDFRDPCDRWQKIKFALTMLPPLFLFKTLRSNWGKPINSLFSALSESDLSELNGFLCEAWFSRAWTFQESVLACDSVILCGSTALRWHPFVRGFGSLHEIIHTQSRKYTARTALIYFERRNRYESPRPLDDYLTSFDAFDRVLRLWIRIERPILRSKRHHKPEFPGTLYDFQKPYINICSKLLPSYLTQYLLHATPVWSLLPFLFWVMPFIDLHSFNPIKELLNGILISLIFVALIFVSALGAIFGFVPSNLLEGYVGGAYETDSQENTDTLLEGIIQTLRQRQATDPKDKSYAMYGVMRTVGIHLFELDYHKSQGQIYHELLLNLLRWHSLAIVLLLDAGTSPKRSRDMDDAPSWVPDWNKLPPKPTISASYFLRNRRFDASPEQVPDVRISQSRRELYLQGHWKAEVSFCIEKLQEVDVVSVHLYGMDVTAPLFKAVTTFVTWIAALRGNARPVEPTSCRSPAWDWYMISTSPDILPPSEPTDLEYHPLLNASRAIDIHLLLLQQTSTPENDARLRNMQTIYDIFAVADSPSCMTDEATFEIVQKLQHAKVLDIFIDIINDMARNDRRLFVTSDGYLGCGSKGLAVGDRLALVAGVPAPLVLRPVDLDTSDWFKSQNVVICSAFVLGWMDGSAYECDKVGEIQLV